MRENKSPLPINPSTPEFKTHYNRVGWDKTHGMFNNCSKNNLSDIEVQIFLIDTLWTNLPPKMDFQEGA